MMLTIQAAKERAFAIVGNLSSRQIRLHSGLGIVMGGHFVSFPGIAGCVGFLGEHVGLLEGFGQAGELARGGGEGALKAEAVCLPVRLNGREVYPVEHEIYLGHLHAGGVNTHAVKLHEAGLSGPSWELTCASASSMTPEPQVGGKVRLASTPDTCCVRGASGPASLRLRLMLLFADGQGGRMARPPTCRCNILNSYDLHTVDLWKNC
jgi:hypothetical protein